MDTKLRDRLDDLATDVAPGQAMPELLPRRARRRATLNVAAAVVGIVVLAVLAGTGLRSILRSADRATSSDPSPSVDRGRSADIAGWVTFTDKEMRPAAVNPETSLVRLISRDNEWILAWSHDGTRALVNLKDTLFIGTSDGGIHRLRSGLPVLSGASWSPDDEQIVYVSPDPANEATSISVVNTHGTADPVSIRTSSPSQSFAWPTWSPDGTSIAYLVIDDEPGAELMVMNADGSAPRSILGTTRVGSWPAVWSPDGSTIAFSGLEGRVGGIYTVRSDGTDLTRIVDLAGASSPAWSPDGTRLAFRVMPDDELYVVDRDGRHLRSLGVFAFKETLVLWLGEGGTQW